MTGVEKTSRPLLSDEFIAQYPDSPDNMTDFGQFVYYRTYSRWLPEESRRETWKETVRRSVEYNCSLAPTPKDEAEKLFDNVFNLKQFLSGRTFWVGGTDVAREHPMSNFNCSFTVLDNMTAFRDLFYLLMVGSGVGLRVLKDDVSKLPKVRTNYTLVEKPYEPVPKDKRDESTSTLTHHDSVKIIIGDSKEGWVEGLNSFLLIISNDSFKDIKNIEFVYDNVRPKGEKLKRFGGTASGHESLENMFSKIDRVIKRAGKRDGSTEVKLKSIDCLDIANIIGENVVVGGVRRTAEIVLVDADDDESISAKSSLYRLVDGEWVVEKDLLHRQMSNNSIFYREKPSRERLHWQIQQMRYSGEPGWVNAEAGDKRRPNFQGVNPCFRGDMKLLTLDGYKTFEELDNKEFKIINEDGNISDGKVWLSGVKPTYEIEFNHRKSIFVTGDHVFKTTDGDEVEAKDLKGMRLKPYLKNSQEYIELFIKLGFIQGDGQLSDLKNKTKKGIAIHMGENDGDVKDFFNIPDDRRNERVFYTRDYYDKLLELGFSKECLPNRTMPTTFSDWSDIEKLSFLRGLYSANGCVIDANRGRIVFKSTSKNLIDEIKDILHDFGIKSNITYNKSKNVEFKNGTYTCKESYDLSIQQTESMIEFYNKIGFIHRYKTEKLRCILEKLGWFVSNVKPTGKEEKVYDFSEPLTHWGVVEGVIAHNCGEILLDSNGLCNLTTLNVAAFVREDKSVDIDGMLEAQRLSARAGLRMTQVTLELDHWNRVHKRDNLLGVSLTGWQDLVNIADISFELQGFLLNSLKKSANHAAREYAEELGVNPPLLVTSLKPEGCTVETSMRVTDQGILTIRDMKSDIASDDVKPGFYDSIGYTAEGEKVTRVYKNEKKDLIKVTLKNNREIIMTPSHPLSVNNEWVEGRNLEVGMKLDNKVGTYRNTNISKLKDVTTEEFRSDFHNHKTPTEMSNDLAYLLGAYYANGCFTTNKRIKYHCGHYKNHEKIQRIWKELFDVETSIVECTDRKSYVQDIASAKLDKWFKENGFNKYDEDGEMTIPLKVRTSHYEHILSFFVGYADNDGCFHSDTFCIDSAKEKFVRHMQEVGEAVGLVFGFSVNSQRSNSFSKSPIYKISLSRTHSTEEAVSFINKHSVKGQDKPVSKSTDNRCKDFFEIKSIEDYGEDYTYDIEVENTHAYYLGGIYSHNSLSQLPTVSSGIHYSHSPYYIRRVRINAHDPLVKVCEELGYPVFPEVGQDPDTCTTKVVEFPVKSPQGRTKYDVSAIEQLENYKMFMSCYIDHNASITVHVRDNEWEDVEQWIWDNWETVVAISLLPLDDSFYELLPYEAITKEEYEKRVSEMQRFDSSLISKYEKEETEIDIGNEGCEAGVCPIR